MKAGRVQGVNCAQKAGYDSICLAEPTEWILRAAQNDMSRPPLF